MILYIKKEKLSCAGDCFIVLQLNIHHYEWNIHSLINRINTNV